MDPDAPPSAGEEVELRLFTAVARGALCSAAFSPPVRVRGSQTPRQALADALVRFGLGLGTPYGLTATRKVAGSQGPTLHPFRSEGGLIDVCFRVLEDPSYPPRGLKPLPGFEKSLVPAIDVDLTQYGAAAEDRRTGGHGRPLNRN